MEKILLKKFKGLFINNIDRNQYGFKPKSSTTSALFDIQEFITSQLNKPSNLAVALITIDFSKAFDRIDHALLITKLSKMTGINYNLLKWLQSYLTDRKQCVRINSTKSDPITVTSGVPQGSSLSPYLYSLFVSDLQSRCAHLVKFADDTTYLFIIRKNNAEIDLNIIESEINNLEIWATQNKSVINVEKSKLLYFSKNVLKNTIFQQKFAVSKHVQL